jgi:GT2 family glycosyltransferase
MSTDIIIVSYQDADTLYRCELEIEKHCPECRVVLIDNNVSNIGWTRAVNRGISLGNSDYVWLLNSDAYVTEGSHKALVERMESIPSCGIVGSMQMDPMSPGRISYGGSSVFYPGGVHLTGYRSKGDHQIACPQIWINGASMFIKRNLIDSIGPLTESLIMYYSDSDYSLRAREAGWSCWYEPKSVVQHVLRSSTKSMDRVLSDKVTFENLWGIFDFGGGKFMLNDRICKLMSI